MRYFCNLCRVHTNTKTTTLSSSDIVTTCFHIIYDLFDILLTEIVLTLSFSIRHQIRYGKLSIRKGRYALTHDSCLLQETNNMNKVRSWEIQLENERCDFVLFCFCFVCLFVLFSFLFLFCFAHLDGVIMDGHPIF